MITTMSYNAFFRYLSSLSFDLLSSSAIFFGTQSTAFLRPWNLYPRGHNKKGRSIAFSFQEANGNIWLSCINLRLIIVWKVSFKTVGFNANCCFNFKGKHLTNFSLLLFYPTSLPVFLYVSKWLKKTTNYIHKKNKLLTIFIPFTPCPGLEGVRLLS